jgi:Fic family protein
VEYVSISRILKKARARYARSFLYTETDDNDATYFILSQLRVLLRAVEELHQYLARKAIELRKAEDLVRRSSKLRDAINPRQLALLNHALRDADARYTVASHQRSHDVTYETSRSDLRALTALGLLEQRKSGRAFVFTPHRNLARRLQRAATSGRT